MWFQLRLQITSGNEWFHSDEADFYRAQNWLCKEMELVLVTPALCTIKKASGRNKALPPARRECARDTPDATRHDMGAEQTGGKHAGQ